MRGTGLLASDDVPTDVLFAAVRLQRAAATRSWIPETAMSSGSRPSRMRIPHPAHPRPRFSAERSGEPI